MAENKKQKGSETVVIKRSAIKLNPLNPKIHLDDEIKRQVKNIRKNGYLGGIVFNAQSGMLVDGHRRVKALDIIHKYDGTPETDYDIKVEKVEFDHKTELEQLSFMALGNSKADYNLVAKYVDDIDYRDVGISDEDYEKIHALAAVEVPDVPMSSFDDEFISQPEEPAPTYELDNTDTKTTEDIMEEHENKPKMTKEQVKGEKAKCDNVASNRQSNQDLYVFLTAETVEEKETLCELLGVQPTNSMMVPMKDILNLIE